MAATFPGVGAQGQDLLEEGLFEVIIQGLPVRITVTTLVDGEGRVLIPLRPILELSGIPFQATAGSLVLQWPPGEWRTVLHLAEGRMEVGGEEEALDSLEFRVMEGEAYLSRGILGRVLAARVEVDWPGLAILVRENPEFPATRRLVREARRARERLAAGRLETDRGEVPFVPRTGGGAGTWGISLAGSRGVYRGSVRGALGGGPRGGGGGGGGDGGFRGRGFNLPERRPPPL